MMIFRRFTHHPSRHSPTRSNSSGQHSITELHSRIGLTNIAVVLLSLLLIFRHNQGTASSSRPSARITSGSLPVQKSNPAVFQPKSSRFPTQIQPFLTQIQPFSPNILLKSLAGSICDQVMSQ